MKPKPTWVFCPGYDPNNPIEHDMRDGCWTCAPWWERVPICPTHKRKLPTSGWCKECRRYYNVKERPSESDIAKRQADQEVPAVQDGTGETPR